MKGEGGIGNKNKSSAARAYSRKSRKAEDSNARGARDKAAISEDSLTCPGCIKCGPPIMVKADEGCDGSGKLGEPCGQCSGGYYTADASRLGTKTWCERCKGTGRVPREGPTGSAKLRETWCVACGLHIEVWDGLCGECIDRELDSELDR